MGHERGTLVPKSKRWREIVDLISQVSDESVDVNVLVSKTLSAVRKQYGDLQKSESVSVAVEFLCALSRAAGSGDPSSALADLGLSSPDNPTRMSLLRTAAAKINAVADSEEYKSLVRQSLGDTISRWWESYEDRDPNLFGVRQSAPELLQHAASGAGFCELSRLYFASLTERYLKYFLEREASSTATNLWTRERLDKALRDHVLTDISHMTFA